MKLSLSWLKDYIKLPDDLTPRQIADLLTLHTAEVESVENQGKGFANMVVGKIMEVKKHPNADKLRIVMTDIGHGSLVQIVCGGGNLKDNMLVAVALPGAFVKWHGEGDLVKLEQAKIRGEESFGMICAGEEIGLKKSKEGEISDLTKIKAAPGTPLTEALGLNDTVIEIDNKSLTHRPDLWGHYGVARELAALTGTKLKKIPLRTTVEIVNASHEKLKVDVQSKYLCPRYMAVKISGIKIEKSPKWLIQKLTAAGHSTYNNIVDITNFIASELGQPMHAFDSRLIEGGIVVRTAQPSEKIKTLDSEERSLSPANLLICDNVKAIAIAGVMGGENSEIKDDTTEIIFEAATFDPVSVRKTSVTLGLRTEAVQRFEKSLDPNLAETAIKRAVDLTLKICKGSSLSSPIVDIKNFDRKQTVIETSTTGITNKIGAEISEKDIIKILRSLEFKVKKSGKKLVIEVPSWRATRDINNENDITEEIARIFGYTNIPSILPQLPIKLPEENIERFLKHKARDILSLGLGLSEIYNYSFYSSEDIRKCALNEKEHLRLKNFLSSDQTHMRTSLMPEMLKALRESLKYNATPKIYEIGRTYKEIGEYMPLEEKWIACLITGERSFLKAKGCAETFLNKFGSQDFETREEEIPHPLAHPAKSATITAKGQKIGYIYEIHPEVLKNYGIKTATSVFEFNFTKLVSLGLRQHKYAPLPKFPSMQFDISVVLPEKITTEEAKKAIRQAGENLIKNLDLFDIYRGEGLEKNEKALAFHVTLQANDRTLTDAEMTEVQKKTFENLEKIDGKIRGK
ncbi:MAG: hypothetical protein ACD_65C00285G0004 [uncultured bacterium]|nr:MAG: hypothetical protein ACD_65C00285G0004 [uncultured bacterium]KKT01907.1 MAG: phenylalanyl-tRNA synthetase subunit beta, phenylalanyl-tRNA synthetase beta chain [Candidatus Peregrinibacteria bacterium GW2011_GWF2_43_17]KKT19266.1 MAG: Phenylalanine-tRNA ligase beta subunit [Candidatus Peregrinibacteria bacterium GW2011_GWA2_43_8]HAU39561.1 phenylalanine--tRNA ligase subunit beta [Candidatus Peregrinibacteria bacterium]